ncbi:MAG: NUDIX domain-containing protein [Parcubacteria group bacterium]|nr:NUDIX domain-containing protein [Parcubacteria group bacterium]
MSQNTKIYPKVGVGVLVFKDKKILMGKRKNVHGAGEWSLPGGHLEYMESIIECARREVLEETGIEIENVRFLHVLNLKDYAPHHYIDIAFTADWKSGEPQVMEPDRCEGWEWHDPEHVPEPVYKAFHTHLEALGTGKTFFDA